MIFAICLAAVTALASVATGAEENLLRNSSFEIGENTPASWSFNHRNTAGEIVWDAERPATGSRAIRLVNAAGQTGNVLQTVQLDEPLPPGTRVTFGAMSATDQVAGAGPGIIVYLQPPTGGRQTVSAAGSAGTHHYAAVTGETLTDRPIASIVIYLCHYGTGVVWWDDAFVRVEKARPQVIRPRRAATADLPPLTSDRCTLVLNDAGAVAQVLAGGREVTGGDLPSGLLVQPWGADILPVQGDLQSRDGAVVQRWEDAEAGLEVSATWSVAGDVIVCRGLVRDLRGADRAVDVLAAIPAGGQGWRWGQSIVEELPLAEIAPVLDTLTFSAISSNDAALSLSVPPTSPSDCSFGWSPELGYHVRFRFGLSPAASGELQSAAPFAFCIGGIDPAWGLRDAADRYQQRYPEAFRKRVASEGLWMFGTPKIELPDPESYAFHEGGPNGWEYDEEHDIATCPYIIPGQREITRLERLPATPAEALEIFRDWTPREDDSRAARGWGDALKEIVENCMLSNREGEPHVVIRDTTWGGNSITFPLNANPWLLDDAEGTTVGRSLLHYVRDQHDDTPQLDGTYVDSLGAWGNYDSFRAEHFAYERVPLCYDARSGRPVIANRFTLLQFLWALRDLLHEREGLVFANGLHPNRRFHFFATDVLGVEGHGSLEQKRTMAGTKPFLLLIYNIHEDPVQMEQYFNLCTHWGIYPSFGNMQVFDTQEKYAAVAELNRRYVPALQKITAAGWRPVTHVTALEGVMVERWGPGEDAALYLTAYSTQAAEATLNIDLAALGLDDPVTARDLLSDESFTGDGAAITLPLTAGRVRVLQVEG